MTSDVQFALSISRPWTTAIERHHKRAENRPRWWGRPNYIEAARRMVGHDLALQSSGTYDLDGAKYIQQATGRFYGPKDTPNKAITSVVRVAGLLMPDDPCPAGQEVWYFGSVALVFDHVRVLPEPVPFSGGFGFLKIPPNTLAKVLEQLKNAKVA